MQAVEHRGGVPEDVAVAVVEGDHHRLRRKGPPVLERLERLQRRDGVIAVGMQPRHLGREVCRAHRQGLCDRRLRGEDRADPVVHQHRQVDRSRRERRRQAQRACRRSRQHRGDGCDRAGRSEGDHRPSLTEAAAVGATLVGWLASRCTRPAAVIAGVLVLFAAGCGGKQQPVTTTTAVVHHGPPPRRIQVTVLDGDTGKPVAGARVSAPGAHGRGSVLVTRIRTKPLVVTGEAPGYGTVTSRLAPGATRLTLSLYRPAGQWLLYGASANRTQYQPAIRLRPPFRVVWGRNLGTLLEFPAVIDDGVAYLSNLHGQLFALSMSDGKVIWHVDMHTREEDSSPAVVGSELVAHVKAGRVLVLDRATGRILWSRERLR